GKRLLAGSTAFIAHFEAEQGRQRIEVRAREGDTLASIGRRYGMSAGMMERINHFARHQQLAAGSPVVVYAKYGTNSREVFVSRAPDPLPPLDPPNPAVLPSVPAIDWAMSEIVALVLAAGQSRRMKSRLSKVLHPIAGRPLLHYPVRVAFE